MKMRKLWFLVLAELLLSLCAGASARPQKLNISYEEQQRTYYVLVPDNITSPAPESEYFASAAIHAGALREDFSLYMDHARRKIPIAVWVGTKDQFFPLDAVRSTCDQLKAHGFPVQLSEMKGHDHDYYSVAGTINKAVWEFLSASQLPDKPYWEKYRSR